MQFSLDARTAALSVGELAGFSIGPRGAGESAAGLWRAQLGTQWHQELRQRTSTVDSSAQFEIPVSGRVFHHGWTISLEGRIDQLVTAAGIAVLREIKTILQPLPADDDDLRRDYPDYFAQLATYLALRRLADPTAPIRGELVFVEAAGGLIQTVPAGFADESLFAARLTRVVEFLDLRLAARDRLRRLHYRPAFTELRPGQETAQADLTSALARGRQILFTAPTGFGKTGVLLEFALGRLRAGDFSRLIYLTSKTTGQLQVTATLAAMTAPGGGAAADSIAAWNLRPKSEHCINNIFHCVRESCDFLHDLESRYAQGNLARFHRFPREPRDIESLRLAGHHARVCPYEISRTALAFNDVWVGDFNYVFAPANAGIFAHQPGFDPADTLLVIDEAHNLPARAADARSHRIQLSDAQFVLAELSRLDAGRGLVRAWHAWTRLLATLPVGDRLELSAEDDVRDAVHELASRLQEGAPDLASLGPRATDTLWRPLELDAWLGDASIEKLLWSPAPGELAFTCLDAAAAIGATLRSFGATIFTTATPGPADTFFTACGLDRDLATPPVTLSAATPWRDHAYRVAYDARVDTRHSQRPRHRATTAATVEALHRASSRAIAVFFPSYAYAQDIINALAQSASPLRVALQPRGASLADQQLWLEQSLAFSDALFLVLGSSFAEGIDLLGDRIGHAMVVGPALPEVNAVQQARAEALRLDRAAAFRRVYQIPGLQKVNQALGRLVRAPGQSVNVLLHCRRFVEPDYASLLAREYQFGDTLATTADLDAWLAPATQN